MDTLRDASRKNIAFIGGKGGVGKTTLSLALAKAIARRDRTRSVLWVQIENPTLAPGETLRDPSDPNLVLLNCEPATAFEEYAALKIGIPSLTRIFVKNAFVGYLAKAAPGIRELLVLGKIWHERSHYAHVIVDMPSTGYGLAMFQAAQNFSQLFSGGPFHKDALEMLHTFGDPTQTAQILVSLPEEMPLIETLELRAFLLKLFPKNLPVLVANRLFPRIQNAQDIVGADPDAWESPIAQDERDYALKRSVVETRNLELWSTANPPLTYHSLPYFVHDGPSAVEPVARRLSEVLA